MARRHPAARSRTLWLPGGLGLFAMGLILVVAACTAPAGSAPPPSTASTAVVPPASASPAVPPTEPVTGEVVVFAAASLTDAFTELGERFTAAHPEARITFNFGASSQLVAQLDQGARADVFASADQLQMDRARAAGRIGGLDQIFATNRLVIIAPADNPATLKTPADLDRPGVKVVTSQPDVPIGVYTQQMLDLMSQGGLGLGFKERVEANVVSREANVRQIVAKVQLGEADAGIVYRSDVTPRVAPQIRVIDVPDDYNTLARYPIAPVADAPNPGGAAVFVAFVMAAPGQEVLTRWGFTPVVSP